MKTSSGQRGPRRGGSASVQGRSGATSQRQLRAGELVRHALAEIFREEEVSDPVLHGVSVTVSEVRMSPDFRHAVCFVEPLGAGVTGAEGAPGPSTDEIVAALNRATGFYRGRLARAIDLRSIPELKFVRDVSYDEAQRMNALFARPSVQRDLHVSDRRLSDVVGDEDLNAPPRDNPEDKA